MIRTLEECRILAVSTAPIGAEIWFGILPAVLPQANFRCASSAEKQMSTEPKPLADIIKQITIENIEILSIVPEHTLQVSALPFHHRDPFDRIIIAQSQVENLPIMTDDGEFGNYGVKIL